MHSTDAAGTSLEIQDASPSRSEMSIDSSGDHLASVVATGTGSDVATLNASSVFGGDDEVGKDNSEGEDNDRKCDSLGEKSSPSTPLELVEENAIRLEGREVEIPPESSLPPSTTTSVTTVTTSTASTASTASSTINEEYPNDESKRPDGKKENDGDNIIASDEITTTDTDTHMTMDPSYISPHHLKVLSSCVGFSSLLTIPNQNESFSLLRHLRNSFPQRESEIMPTLYPCHEVSLEEKLSIDSFVEELEQQSVWNEETRDNSDDPLITMLHNEMKEDEQKSELIIDELVKVYNIPSVFFSDSFSLSDESTFNDLIAKYKVSTQIQEEKLEYYLSIIDIYLMKEVISNSESLLAIDNSMEVLEKHISCLHDDILAMKSKTEQLHSQIAPSLKLRNDLLEKSYQKKFVDYLSRIESIFESEQLILRILGERGPYIQAIDLMECVESVAEEFREISQLESVFDSISKEKSKLKSKLVFDLTQIFDMHFHPNSLESKVTGKIDTSHQIFPFQLRVEEYSLDDKIFSLLKLKGLREVITSHFSKTTEGINDVLKRSVSLSNQTDFKLENRHLAHILSMFTSTEYYACLLVLFNEYRSIIAFEGELISFLLQFATNHQSTLSKGTSNAICKDIQSQFENIFQLCHSKLTQSLTYVKASSILQRRDLLDVLTRIQDFIHISGDFSERILERKQATSLKDTMMTLGSEYLENVQKAKLKALNDFVKQEKWEIMKDNSQLVLLISETLQLMKNLLPDTDSSNNGLPSVEMKGKFILLDGTSFFVTSSCAMLCSLVFKYIHILPNSKSGSYTFFKSWEIVRHIIQLFKVYNSEVRLYILGSKWTEYSGKPISINQLLASSCILEFTEQIVVRIEHFFSSFLDENQKFVLLEFASLMSEIHSHQTDSLTKVEDIMNQLFQSELSKWKQLDWQSTQTPTQNMMGMANAIVRLRKKLVSYQLRPDTLTLLFDRIHQKFLRQLGVAKDTLLSRLDNQEIADKIHADIKEMEEYIQSQLM